jgi:hypothetical protein
MSGEGESIRPKLNPFVCEIESIRIIVCHVSRRISFNTAGCVHFNTVQGCDGLFAVLPYMQLERQIAIIKQSSRGQLEIFASVADDAGTIDRGSGPRGRPVQIVPHYMKETALKEVIPCAPNAGSFKLQGGQLPCSLCKLCFSTVSHYELAR